MSYRRLIAASVLGALLCSCRGPGGQTMVPSGTDSYRRATAGAVAVASGGIGFTPLGPTHMSSYFGQGIGAVPESGKLNAYAADPKNPNLIYMAGGRGTGLETYSSAGIYRSTNGGASWQPVQAAPIGPSDAWLPTPRVEQYVAGFSEGSMHVRVSCVTVGSCAGGKGGR